MFHPRFQIVKYLFEMKFESDWMQEFSVIFRHLLLEFPKSFNHQSVTQLEQTSVYITIEMMLSFLIRITFASRSLIT